MKTSSASGKKISGPKGSNELPGKGPGKAGMRQAGIHKNAMPENKGMKGKPC
jgi:hypothetical protein